MDGPPSCRLGCADIDEFPVKRKKKFLRWTAFHVVCFIEDFEEKIMDCALKLLARTLGRANGEWKSCVPLPQGFHCILQIEHTFHPRMGG